MTDVQPLAEGVIPIPDSILDSVKKVLGFDSEYEAFDLDIILHINSVFSTLSQLGVGPKTGFSIEDNAALWSEFLLGDLNLNAVKSYVYIRVRLLFDPPATSFAQESMSNQARELEWRLNVHVEGVKLDAQT